MQHLSGTRQAHLLGTVHGKLVRYDFTAGGKLVEDPLDKTPRRCCCWDYFLYAHSVGSNLVVQHAAAVESALH